MTRRAVAWRWIVLLAVGGCLAPSKPEWQDDLATSLQKARSLDARERRLAIANMSGSKDRCALAPVVPELARLLKDPDAEVRFSACVGLGTAEEYARGVKGDLIEALHDSSSEVRSAAAASLGQIGSLSESDVRALAGALSDADRSVKLEAESSIMCAGAVSRAALPELENALHDADSAVVSGAASAIGKSGAASDSTIRALICLVDDRTKAQASAAWALGSLGMRAQKAIPSLQKALSSSVAVTRVAAARSLWKLAGNTKDTLPVLVSCLNVVTSLTGKHHDYVAEAPEIDHNARAMAIEALVEIGRSGNLASDAVKLLLRENEADHGGVPRGVVNDILQQMQPSATQKKDGKGK